MSTPPRLIEVVGSLNIDLVTVTPRVPGPGETLTASSFSTGFGGKGANQAVACARLLRHAPRALAEDDIQVRMVGAVGDDQFGVDFRGHLEREGINSDGVRIREGQKTGTAVILVEEHTGENRILLSTGANGSVGPDDVQLKTGEAGLVIFQLEIPLPTVIDSMRRAKEQGKSVILNPAPAVALPDEAFNALDHLILNESEASILSGIAEDQLGSDFESVADHFHERGVDVFVLTLGSKGVYWRNRQLAETGSKGVVIAARKVPVVDTTAAGDTFVGAYAVWLTRYSNDVDGAVRFANLAASLSVQKHGAQTAIPFLDEVGVSA